MDNYFQTTRFWITFLLLKERDTLIFNEDGSSCSDTIYYCKEGFNTVLDTTKALKAEEESLLNIFIHRMIEISLNRSSTEYEKNGMTYTPIFSGSGNEISIFNTSKSLQIEYFNFDQTTNTWYGLMRHWIYSDVLEEIGGERSLYPVRKRDYQRYINFKNSQYSLEQYHSQKQRSK